MTDWTPERVWDVVDAWRWFPPTAKRLETDEYELAVTPGSYALTYVYSFRVEDTDRADDRLDLMEQQIRSLGGTGANVYVSPRTRPTDLGVRLERRGYQLGEEAEVLVWRLRADDGAVRLPQFSPAVGVRVGEIDTEPDYLAYTVLTRTIFGGPVESEEVRAEFLSEFHRRLRESGNSDRYLAWEGESPIGVAGMEVNGRVARLWGSGVRADRRGRGAYGALVRARCDSAVRRGAEVALVNARVGTSGPILKRHGFESVGVLRVYEVTW